MDTSGALGMLWMGVKEFKGAETAADMEKDSEGRRMVFAATEWRFLQTIHVFGTQQVQREPHSSPFKYIFIHLCLVMGILSTTFCSGKKLQLLRKDARLHLPFCQLKMCPCSQIAYCHVTPDPEICLLAAFE